MPIFKLKSGVFIGVLIAVLKQVFGHAYSHAEIAIIMESASYRPNVLKLHVSRLYPNNDL